MAPAESLDPPSGSAYDPAVRRVRTADRDVERQARDDADGPVEREEELARPAEGLVR
jgi:hypothetical protein